MKAWFEQLAPRERLTLLAGVVIAVPLLFYILVWGPMRRDIATLETGVAAQRETMAWMHSAAAEIQRLRATGRQAPTASTDASLLSIVNQSAQRLQLADTIQRMSPQGDSAIELQLSGVAFDRFIHWLNELNDQYGVSISSLSLSRAGSTGQVDVRLTLERPA